MNKVAFLVAAAALGMSSASFAETIPQGQTAAGSATPLAVSGQSSGMAGGFTTGGKIAAGLTLTGITLITINAADSGNGTTGTNGTNGTAP